MSADGCEAEASGGRPTHCKRLCQEAKQDFSLLLPFLFKSLFPVALHACSYFALWETFSLATVANLSTFQFLPCSGTCAQPLSCIQLT